MGDERAETYLALVAEAELRWVGSELHGLDVAARAESGSDLGLPPPGVADRAFAKFMHVGRLLMAAGAIEENFLRLVAADLDLSFKVRSRLLMNHERRPGPHHRRLLAVPSDLPPERRPAVRPMRVTPAGQAVRVDAERAPSVLHLLSLVRTPGEAMLTVVIRMHWPPDGSSVDLEITGAGPQHLPFGRMEAVDDRGARYTVQFQGELGGTTAWPGVARLAPVPPEDARWLDLIGDEARLARISLQFAGPVESAVIEPTETSAGERLLIGAAERILAGEDVKSSVQGLALGDAITVLTRAGTVPADSPVPGQLAALAVRLGTGGAEIGVPLAELPARWASVLAQRAGRAAGPGRDTGAEPDLFAPLGVLLPDVDGARVALTGLSTAGGESYLHVVGTGLPSGLWARDRRPDYSWWLRDSAGNWHLGTEAERAVFEDDAQVVALKLTPPLAVLPDAVEIEVTGPSTRVRTTVPIRL